MEEVFTPSSLFLLAAALFLVVISVTIVLALYSEKHRDRIAGFLLEGSTEAKGKPSLSRLQMLIWNIVVAFGFLFILANAPPEDVMMIDGKAVLADLKAAVVDGKPVFEGGKAVLADGKAVLVDGKPVFEGGKAVFEGGKPVGVLTTALAALLSPAILILLGVSNATYLLGKVAKPGAPESPPGDQSGDASKPDASTPAAPAPMG